MARMRVQPFLPRPVNSEYIKSTDKESHFCLQRGSRDLLQRGFKHLASSGGTSAARIRQLGVSIPPRFNFRARGRIGGALDQKWNRADQYEQFGSTPRSRTYSNICDPPRGGRLPAGVIVSTLITNVRARLRAAEAPEVNALEIHGRT
jgi:hypothetical protein